MLTNLVGYRDRIMSRLFGFPDPVNEVSARLVAGGVVVVAGTALLSGQTWLVLPLAYGFAPACSPARCSVRSASSSPG